MCGCQLLYVTLHRHGDHPLGVCLVCLGLIWLICINAVFVSMLFEKCTCTFPFLCCPANELGTPGRTHAHTQRCYIHQLFIGGHVCLIFLCPNTFCGLVNFSTFSLTYCTSHTMFCSFSVILSLTGYSSASYSKMAIPEWVYIPHMAPHGSSQQHQCRQRQALSVLVGNDTII